MALKLLSTRRQLISSRRNRVLAEERTLEKDPIRDPGVRRHPQISQGFSASPPKDWTNFYRRSRLRRKRAYRISLPWEVGVQRTWGYKQHDETIKRKRQGRRRMGDPGLGNGLMGRNYVYEKTASRTGSVRFYGDSAIRKPSQQGKKD